MAILERNSIINDIKNEFNYGSMTYRLVLVNLLVFLGITVLWLLCYFTNLLLVYEWATNQLMATADLNLLPFKLWSVLTYMFAHKSFWHLFFNMVLLYVFGDIISNLLGNRRILPIYILGGISGFLVYLVLLNTLPFFSPQNSLLGASASVMALVTASTTLSPNSQIRIFVFDVPIKYIALALLLNDVLRIFLLVNAGGHIAHLGGALFGYLFIVLIKRGYDLSLGFNSIADKLTNVWNKTASLFIRPNKERNKTTAYQQAKRPKSAYAFAGKKEKNPENYTTVTQVEPTKQERLDSILDKIKSEGIDSLNDEEKQFLENFSRE